MRVAAIYDIHGNLPALEAVLDDIHREDVDIVVVGGDVIPGPMPGASIEALLSLGLPTHFIRGNGEREVLALLGGADPASVPVQYRDVIVWSAQALSQEHAALLATWRASVRLEVPGPGDVLFCHATPYSDSEIFTVGIPDERVRSLFEGQGAPLVVCGHTHMQFDRTAGGVRVVNAGSVGMPFGEPGAYWPLLDGDVDFRRTAYDTVRASERIRETDYPQAEQFATASVIRPPSEAEMTRTFEGAGLGG